MGNEVEEIKSRLDIVDIIGEYIQLKPAGTNFKARCPFHNEKSPSFMVSRPKQIFHCFGCNEGGDMFSFIQKYEGLEFPEALRLLAGKAGVSIEKHDPKVKSDKNKLFEINHEAMKFFHELLLKHPRANIAREYLQGRGLKESTINKFQIGYAPDGWEVTRNFLNKKGYRDEDIVQTGLILKSQNRSGYYDRFRNRVAFPFFDHNNNAVGFSCRVLDEEKDKMGKYVNTPDTKVFHKSQLLYGLNFAKPSIREKDLAVVVEGQMDVIASHQAGVEYVIASSGTALTDEQVKLIKRYTKNIALSFDEDAAGIQAAMRGMEVALANGMNVLIIDIDPEHGKDPDECIQKDPNLWIQAITAARPFSEYYFDSMVLQADTYSVEGKKQAAANFLNILKKVPDRLEQSHYIQQLAKILQVQPHILEERLISGRKQRRNYQPERDTPSEESKQKIHDPKMRLLALLIAKPQWTGELMDYLTGEEFQVEAYMKIYKLLKNYYNSVSSQKRPNFEEFEQFIAANDDTLIEQLSLLTLLAQKDFFDFDQKEYIDEIRTLSAVVRKQWIHDRLGYIGKELAIAEKKQDRDYIDTLSKEFTHLTSLLHEEA